MEQINVTKAQLILAMIVSFSVGFATCTLLKMKQIDRLPFPVETTLKVEDMSFQMTAVVQTSLGKNLWIKEDQPRWFISESGIPARSTITNLTLNCDTPSITIHEQRVFGENMVHVATENDVKHFNLSESAISVLLLMSKCQLGANQKMNRFA